MNKRALWQLYFSLVMLAASVVHARSIILNPNDVKRNVSVLVVTRNCSPNLVSTSVNDCYFAVMRRAIIDFPDREIKKGLDSVGSDGINLVVSINCQDVQDQHIVSVRYSVYDSVNRLFVRHRAKSAFLKNVTAWDKQTILTLSESVIFRYIH